MTIDELKKEKEILEEAIYSHVREFNQETDMQVSHISIDYRDTKLGRIIVGITTLIK